MDDDLIECCEELYDDKPGSWWTFLLFLWVWS